MLFAVGRAAIRATIYPMGASTTPIPMPDLVQELAKTRHKLRAAMRRSAAELQTMQARCADLQNTMLNLGEPSAYYRAKEAAWQRLSRHHLRDFDYGREIQVLKAIADGQSSKQLAYELKITFKTAVSHRTRLMQKLDIHEMASLVRLAVVAGLISPDRPRQ